MTKLCVAESGHSRQRRPAVRFTEPVMDTETDRDSAGYSRHRGAVLPLGKGQVRFQIVQIQNKKRSSDMENVVLLP